MKESVKQEIQDIMKRYNVDSFDYIPWHFVSAYGELSDDFMREYKIELNWAYISHYQKLSYEFIYEFRNKLYLDVLVRRELITPRQRRDMNKISKYEILDI
jgi:hypothetical protein